MPFLNQMTVQMNQTQASFQCILQSLVNQNRQQIIEIAKLKQIREEMPRMFCESPVNGFGFCIDHGKEKMIGKLKVRNVYHCYIMKNECKEELLYVSYSCKDNDIHHTVVPLNKLSSKNLLPLFESFCYVCRNKSLANDYIAHCINNFSQKSTLYFPEYAGFSFFENDEKGTFVRFDCNRKKIEMELLKHCSPCFIEKVLPSVQNRPLSIKSVKSILIQIKKYCSLFSPSVVC